MDAVASFPDPSRYIVSTFKETYTDGEVYKKILDKAEKLGCRSVSWRDVCEDPEAFSRHENLDAIVTIGWRYLLPTILCEITKYGIIVFHDSLLPRHRGFAPLATAILCGDRKTGLSVLRANDEVDAGDIILQKEMPLRERDTIANAIERITPLFREALGEILLIIENEEPLPSRKQDHSAATYSIWRGPEDGRIDWDQDSSFIDRLIRSAGYPYNGAYTTLEGRKIIVYDSIPIDDKVFDVRQSGKIWCLKNEGPVVVCGRGMLQIRSAIYEDGTPHLPLSKMRLRYGT